MFSYITMNWRGKPLVSLETIINLIGATKTSTGLEVYARLDDREYPAKIRVTDAELAAVNLHRETFHPGVELQHQTTKLIMNRALAGGWRSVMNFFPFR